MNTFRIAIDQMQPSVLYLSRARLDIVMRNTAFIVRPVPVREIHGRLCIVEVHERLLALQMLGAAEAEVYVDEAQTDYKIWEHCVVLCESQGISSINDLEDRIIGLSGYRQLWIERRRELHHQLRINEQAA